MRITPNVAVVAALLVSSVAQIAFAQDGSKEQTTLTLLGTTGGPGALPSRAGIASLVSVGDRHYLVDAGEGVARQLARANLAEADVTAVFLTHLHDDHTAGLPTLMTFAYTGRAKKMTIYGPPGTARLVKGALAFLEVNAEIRNTGAPGARQPPDAIFEARELEPGQSFDDGVIKVAAVENSHYALNTGSALDRHRSYAYRFFTADKVIAFTGDTGPSEAVERLAEGADILVAEIASAEDIESVPPFVREHMLKEHLTAAELGRLAADAKVRTLVLSHYRAVGPSDVAAIAQQFDGKIVVGEDLSRF